MTSPQLSFCIATLNRGNIISETLDSIIDQLDREMIELVEIVIVDGASTDNTKEVIERYRQQYDNITYIRLAQKGGVDKDYAETVKHASGEYCWMMSDDDLLKPGVISKVLAELEQGYDLVIVNSEVRSADFGRLIVPSLLSLQEDRIYYPAENEQFFCDTTTYMSFIGCVVIKRQLWNQRQIEPYFGTEFIHIGVIFQSPLPEKILVLSKPWIVIRYNNASWSSRYFEIWMFKWPKLIWSFEQYSETSRALVALKEPWRNMKLLAINRARGAYSSKEFDKYLASQTWSPVEKQSARLIARTPGWLVNLLLLLYFRLRGQYDVVMMEDFRNSSFYLPNLLWKMVPGSR